MELRFKKIPKKMTLKTLVLALMCLNSFSQALAFVNLENRSDVSFEGGRLTPFWAQEYIGADLVKAELQKRSDRVTVPFSIYDSGFEKKHINVRQDLEVDTAFNGSRPVTGHHGTSVATLVNGTGMVSVSEVVDYVQLRRVSPALFYNFAVKEIKTLQVQPWIISNSMGWTSPTILDLARDVDALGIIWVMASGNDYPDPIVEHERIAPVISVGSFSPRGFQTLTSQQSDQLDILAPADQFQASRDGKGEDVLFGETSGATPLVSGSIANVKSLMPQLSRAQIETLIKKTAFRSLHSLYLKDNQTGLFNAYKLYKVVERLKNQCQKNGECLERSLEDDRLYVFQSEPLSEKILNVCSGKDILNLQEATSLRRNQLLVNESQYSRLLGCAYRNIGYDINADFYFNLYGILESPLRVQKKIQALAVEAVKKGYHESSALRDIELLNASFEEALLQIIDAPEDSGIGKYKARKFLEAYKKTPPVTLPERLR